MDKNVYRKSLKRIKKLEKQHGNLENYAKVSTNFDDKHRLKIEEDYSSIYQEMTQVYNEFSDMELADLLDYQNLVGRFDGYNHKAW